MRRQGETHRPYEFGVNVTVAVTLKYCKGGQSLPLMKTLPGNPYDGQTLATLIPDMEAFVGNTVDCRRISRPQRAARLQVQGLSFRAKARSDASAQARIALQVAFEPIIGDLKAEHRMRRNYLWFRQGDQ
jgi:transposase, IS5 family